MAVTGFQIKAARSLVGMEQTSLAEKAGISPNTIRNMEASGSDRVEVGADTLDAVVDALKAAGVILIDEGSSYGGPGVRMGTAAKSSIDTDTSETVQYREYLENDAPPGAGG